VQTRPRSTDATASGARGDWRELKQVISLFAILLASSLVGGLAGRVWETPVLDASLAVFDAIVVLGFVVMRFRDVAPTLTVRAPGGRAVAETLAVALAFVLVVQGYFACLEALGVPMLRLTDTFMNAGWPVWSVFLLICASPGVVEELAFRGVLQGGLRRIVTPREALVVQAALFSVLHLLPVIFPSHFFMGLALGLLRDRTQSLYPGMVLHASWNAYVVQEELSGISYFS
jgi:membrane protease YdiL (CAAX protease family)